MRSNVNGAIYSWFGSIYSQVERQLKSGRSCNDILGTKYFYYRLTIWIPLLTFFLFLFPYLLFSSFPKQKSCTKLLTIWILILITVGGSWKTPQSGKKLKKDTNWMPKKQRPPKNQAKIKAACSQLTTQICQAPHHKKTWPWKMMKIKTIEAS